jgi:uncharacterized membrane protein
MFAFINLSPPLHQVMVLLHIFGAIIFMGNMIVTAMWMAQAKRSQDEHVLHFAVRSVVRADLMFTLPGVILILVTGLLTIGGSGGFGHASWAELGLALFIFAGIIWGSILVPHQRKMLQLTQEAVELRTRLTDQFYTLLGRWMMWGGIATLLPLLALYLMVYKPKLWG